MTINYQWPSLMSLYGTFEYLFLLLVELQKEAKPQSLCFLLSVCQIKHADFEFYCTVCSFSSVSKDTGEARARACFWQNLKSAFALKYGNKTVICSEEKPSAEKPYARQGRNMLYREGKSSAEKKSARQSRKKCAGQRRKTLCIAGKLSVEKTRAQQRRTKKLCRAAKCILEEHCTFARR